MKKYIFPSNILNPCYNLMLLTIRNILIYLEIVKHYSKKCYQKAWNQLEAKTDVSASTTKGGMTGVWE
ncbi:hypothetical protein D9X91_15685 [Falsibacillus albus]|uniref:Uncharacterized protein n=1 Tax=Falsibacillus albus TaxID=2478915 RepID=A0A3L7JU77_9BACI|nr:hypothetical protein D9X91_15685 [Falsibacillus albus]